MNNVNRAPNKNILNPKNVFRGIVLLSLAALGVKLLVNNVEGNINPVSNINTSIVSPATAMPTMTAKQLEKLFKQETQHPVLLGQKNRPHGTK